MPTQPILIGADSRGVLSAFTPEPVSLAALTSAGVAIEWHEAVAIVQETSRLVLQSPHQSANELSSADVRIDSAGSVLVPRGGVQDGPSAVSQLGALLRDLLPDMMPVPLRLAISQAMSSPPHYASIRSFSEALSYFERPDRSAIIRGVYERWEGNAGSRTPAQPRHDPARKGQSPAEEPPRQQRPAQTAPRAARRWLVVAGSVALAMTFGVVAALWAPRSDNQTVDGVAASSAPNSDGSSDAAAANPAAPGVARPATTSRAPAPPAATAPDADPQTPIQRAQLESAVVLQPTAAPSLRSPASTDPVSLDVRQPLGSQPSSVSSQMAPSITLVELAQDSRIYSSLDTDVAAPVAAYPQSPTVSTVFHDDEMLTFDLVIDESGKVESVKLRRAPSSIRSALMLTMSMSVAKAWRFQPATRNGRSVKYRQAISVPAPQ